MAYRFLPSSFLWRTILLALIPMAVSMLVVGWAFFNDHWKRVQHNMSRSLAGEIAAITRLLDTSPEIALQMAHDIGINMTRPAYGKPIHANSNGRSEVSFLHRELVARMPIESNPNLFMNKPDRILYIEVNHDDSVLRFRTNLRRVYSSSTEAFLAWILGTMIVVSLLLTPFVISHNKSVRRLARAANKFGRGFNAPGFEPAGSLEIREAGQALLDMKERIDRYNKTRSDMLSAVSHDLKSPLSRMKTAAETDTIDSAKLVRDIDRMTEMVNGYLSFARGEVPEIEQEISIAPMIMRLVKDMDTKGIVKMKFPAASASFYARPNAISRALANIVDNALRHAKSKIEITEHQINDEEIEITVDDNGPGIPRDLRAEALRPFSRLDNARAADTGGTGLGLNIAQTTIENHGGELRLEDSPLGGLRVRVILPI